MFERGSAPNVYGMPPGADFPACLAAGLRQAYADRPPEALARVRIIVNTRRMERRISALFAQGPALLLPRISVVAEPGEAPEAWDVPQAVSPLRQRLELSSLVARFLDSERDVAPRSALFDLSDSLSKLLEEMESEGVAPEVLRNLDVSQYSAHWERSLKFVTIVQDFLEGIGQAPTRAARARQAVLALTRHWQAAPPQDPVILAGSTGSQGTTALLIEAVAALPQGVVILPGVDFDMPTAAWDDLDDALSAEDHPQFRFRTLMRRLGIGPQDIRRWPGAEAPNPARNRLVSLALRPAPVTDRWLAEGPELGPLAPALEGVTLLEAATQREEALVIAMRLRQAVEDGQTAALITPDRMLTRQVTAALDRWKIEPDDSAGLPLHLTAPGRFLRHIADLFRRDADAEQIITILLHPLCHSGDDRGGHLLLTRELELYLRRKAVPYPQPDDLAKWARSRDAPEALAWADWIATSLMRRADPSTLPLCDHVARHVALAEQMAHGSGGAGRGGLWEEAAGREARRVMTELAAEAEHGTAMSAGDYADLIGALLSRGVARTPDASHPGIRIWGTLEARVQGADVLILGSLNEGSWPEMPPPDPWLNRRMRHDAGLLLPERRIGLSAHDFQQAVAAPEVWLTRATRSADAQTVPSRWLNRITNLLNGLPAQGGTEALRGALARGQRWRDLARALESVAPIPAARRPSPRPPAHARPRTLSVTEIRTLKRDPYAIHAKHVLRLVPVDPLMRAPDAALRGTVIHKVLEVFIARTLQDPATLTPRHLVEVCREQLDQLVPWPEVRALWEGRIARVAEWFVKAEVERQAKGHPVLSEHKGQAAIEDLGFTLVGKPDRIDMGHDGRITIYDYKSGTPPTEPAQVEYDRQLLLLAAMAERGAFDGLAFAEVAAARYIGLGTNPKETDAPLDKCPPQATWEELTRLLRPYLEGVQGFTSRRAMHMHDDVGDYDQLARFGEWDISDAPEPEDLT